LKRSKTVVNNGGSVNTDDNVHFIKSFDLINPIELFKFQIASQNPENLSKRMQLAQESRTIIQKLENEQRAALKQSLKIVKSEEIVSVGRCDHQILRVHSLKVTKLPCLNPFLV
jgi:hypothetical protein